ncbi:MAG: hypothetical protein ABS939_25115, partial [Psychrobacillus sp.]
TIREQFLKQNKDLLKKRPVKKSSSTSIEQHETATANDYEQENLASLESVLPESEEEETIVTEAMELFGKEMVEVKED